MFATVHLRFIFCCLVAFFASLGLFRPAYAAPFEYKKGGISLVIAAPTGDAPDVLLTFPPTTKIKHFSLENPARIVVDVELSRANVKSSTTPLAGAVLSGIRIGAHPDKIRIVLDLVRSIETRFLPDGAGSLRIMLGRSKIVPQARGGTENKIKVVTNSPTPSPTATLKQTAEVTPAVPTEKPTPIAPPSTATATPNSAMIETNDITPTPAAVTSTPTSAATPTAISTATAPAREAKSVYLGRGSITVSAINFDYNPVDKAPVIRIALSGRSEYKLSKRDDRSFSLLLPDARLSNSGTGLPQFPPQDFNGLTFVLAAAKDNSVDISIGVERGIRVTAFAKDQEIWVRAVNR
jgi:hypothetical protein